MRVLIIGARGQLGSELCKTFADVDCCAVDVDQVDVTDFPAVQDLIANRLRPDVVINTAAAHNVPQCEKDPAWSFAVNEAGARNVAQACKAAKARCVFISTDYVFGHGGTHPYVETNRPAPVNVYGESKLAGERAVADVWHDSLIIRSAAMYGHAPCLAKAGRNFVSLMLHLAETRDVVRVVNDEFTTPTYAPALAAQIRHMVTEAPPGLYHATCQGGCSWFEFAQAIFEEAGLTVNLQPARAADFASEVARPCYSVLDNQALRELGLDILPPWREALARYFQDRSRRSADL